MKKARDPETAGRLWELSAELTGLRLAALSPGSFVR